MPKPSSMLIGVLSDTHGLLRPELLPALAGVDHILHTGDVGDPAILTELARIAPVTAIRGNVDTHGPNSLLPATELIELAGCLIYMVHAREDLDLIPQAAGIATVIYGHSHKPSIKHHRGVLYLNPGSAGPRRFDLPITYALLRIQNAQPQAEILPLLP
ncbi:metallophosphoesterase family protein [Granulicella sp. L46]|uniref:metallophosphoesterase family protein n=1 Tax=Granulicella sp. L46 TaxID=1641865 RepID=UPI0020B176C4|nr:metallophosphoesterase family protein [Granulicella sp. L46]